MSAKTKIVVLRMKELIYTGIFVLLGILLLLLLISMFAPEKDPSTKQSAPTEQAHSDLYKPGVYTASILLGGNAIDLCVITESDYIASIQLVNLNETIATMYPLVEPALDQLTEQIYNTQSLENLTYPEENQYTSMVILDAIRLAVEKAKLELSHEKIH